MKYSAAAVVLVLQASVAYAASFVGCVGLLGLPISVPQLPATSLSQCQSFCTILAFAYYAPSTLGCYCSAFGPPAGTVQTGSSSSCSGYIGSKITTTFSDAACFSSVTVNPQDASAPSSVVTSVDQCFENCKAYRYAITKPQSGLFPSWTCKCANFPYTTSGSGCTSSSNYVYTHSAAAAASQLARREEKAKLAREQVALNANPYCPATYTACYVSEDNDDGYECLRPDVELESCGGCRFGEYASANTTLGVDCTSIARVLPSGVTCNKGHCVISQCRRGFRLVDGECLRRSQ